MDEFERTIVGRIFISLLASMLGFIIILFIIVFMFGWWVELEPKMHWILPLSYIISAIVMFIGMTEEVKESNQQKMDVDEKSVK